MPIDKGWIEHPRGDGELLGWMLPAGEGFIAIDLLMRPVSAEVDWMSAEEALESIGIGYLADPFELLLDDGTWHRVRITEVSTDRVRVKREDWGDMTVPLREFTVPFPIDNRLRPRRSTSR